METMTVNTFAAAAAGFVPGRVAPTPSPLQGRGVSAAGHIALGGGRPRTATEPDSAMEAPPV